MPDRKHGDSQSLDPLDSSAKPAHCSQVILRARNDTTDQYQPACFDLLHADMRHAAEGRKRTPKARAHARGESVDRVLPSNQNEKDFPIPYES